MVTTVTNPGPHARGPGYADGDHGRSPRCRVHVRVADMRRPFLSRAAVAALVPLACAASSAAAQIAPGSTLTFTGTADATDVGLGGVVLDFTKHVTAGAGNTGAFASLNTNGRGPKGKIADIRVGNGPELIPSFLQFGGYKFTLLGLPSGREGQDDCYTDQFAVGQTCTPFQSVQGQPQINAGLSPFYVANLAGPDGSINSTAAFDLYGTVTGPGNARSSFVGTITASFVGVPYQMVLYTLEQQGLQGLTFTGTFTTGALLAEATVTPEPTTVGLVAVGLLGVVGAARRRSRSTTPR